MRASPCPVHVREPPVQMAGRPEPLRGIPDHVRG
jgi:hypothetical protein